MATSVLEEQKTDIIDQYLGDASHPIEWKDEADKKLHYWFDDLHQPQPEIGRAHV